MDCLLKWFAPILSFTTEEIFSIINKNNTSIHLEKFTKIPFNWQNKSLNDKWITLKKIRDNCNISIEEKRANKIIGSSLEANIDLKLLKKNYLRLPKIQILQNYVLLQLPMFQKLILTTMIY